MTNISELLRRDLANPIEEVVKVGQQDDKTVLDEIREYVATDRIKKQYLQVLDPIAQFRDPTERVGVWVSGFFGSGKSSFIKNLGYILSNRPVSGYPAGRLFIEGLEGQAPHDPQVDKIGTTLNFINQNLKMLVLMFDVQVDLPAGSSGDPLARIMYNVLLRELDYADNDYDIAELEIELEHEGRLAEFIRLCAATYGSVARSKPAAPPVTVSGVSDEEYGVWRAVRLGASRLDRTGRLLHEMDPATYPANNTWTTEKRREPEISVAVLVARTFELTARRKPGYGVAYIMDEVGQYVAHSTPRLENLRAIVEHFGQESKNRVGRLKNPAPSPVWIVISSQEKLDEVVSALGINRVELAKVQDRFPITVDMAPADIREVATKRVLAKNTTGAELLGKLFDKHGALLKTHTRLERTARPHEVRRDDFIQFYPYLPHFIDLSIDIISGVRGQAGAPRHIGGSNRTIIKQAYEMLARPGTGLQDKPVGKLVTLDAIYELVQGNLPSEMRKEIDDVDKSSDLNNQWPIRVAKALALLNNVRDLPRTEENLAALLYDRLGDDSPLVEVREAIEWLKTHQFIGQDQGGWKLLTAAEKNWQTERDAYGPPPREQNNILEEQLKEIFTVPALSAFHYRNLRTFRSRVEWSGRILAQGDHIPVQLRLADGPEEFAHEVERAATDSQNETSTKSLYWVIARTNDLDEAIVQVARSSNMITRYTNLGSNSKLTGPESAALEAEKNQRDLYRERLKSQLQGALANGRGIFDGVRRSGSDFNATTYEDAIRGFYGYAVPELYPKLEMGVRPSIKNDDADKILKAANLNALPTVFYNSPTGFDLVVKRDGGKYVVDIDAPLLKEIRAYIQKESSYGNKVSGKGLEEHFGRSPYGWEARTLMLALAAMLRGGALVVTYQGRRYRDHLDPQVHDTFSGTTAFRSASFAPRTSIGLGDLVNAARRYASLTGDDVDIEETAIAAAYKALAAAEEDRFRMVDAVLRANDMPGLDTVNEYGEMLASLRSDPSDEVVLRMANEGLTFQELREKAGRIAQGYHDKGITRLRRMRLAANHIWPALIAEDGLVAPERQAAVAALDAYTRSESFYEAAPEQDDLLRELESTYHKLYSQRHTTRAGAYAAAIDAVRVQNEWDVIGETAGESLLHPLQGRDHEIDLPAGSLACLVCGASLAGLAADLAAVGRRQADALARLRELAAPPETKVERIRLADVVGPSPSLSTTGEVDILLDKLRDHLYPLVVANIQVILE